MHRLIPPLDALGLCVPSIASAEEQDERVAIVAVIIGGDAAAQLQAQMNASIELGIENAGATAVGLDRVRKAISKETELIGCTSTTCLNRVGELVDTTLFISANVESRGATYSYELTLHALDSDDGVRRRAKDSCSVCTITELSDMIAASTVELLTSADGAPVEVEIVSRPPGATLRIANRELGVSPFAGELAPGSYVVTASLDGYLDAEQTIEVTGAGDQRFELVLTTTPTDIAPTGTSAKYSTWKWVAGGGGVVGIVGGIVLLSMHGDATCTLVPPDMQCPEERNTLLGGIASVTAGVGLAALSTWMFLHDRKLAKRNTEAALIPTVGGGVAIVRFSF